MVSKNTITAAVFSSSKYQKQNSYVVFILAHCLGFIQMDFENSCHHHTMQWQWKEFWLNNLTATRFYTNRSEHCFIRHIVFIILAPENVCQLYCTGGRNCLNKWRSKALSAEPLIKNKWTVLSQIMGPTIILILISWFI